MNAALLSQRLIGRSDDIYTILETLGYENITFNSAKAQFRFSRADGTNPTSIVLDVDSLRFYCFSTNGKGNLFTLIMSRLNCTFPDSLTFVTTVLVDSTKNRVSIESPLGKALMGHRTGDRVYVEVNPQYGYYVEIRDVCPFEDDVPLNAY